MHRTMTLLSAATAAGAGAKTRLSSIDKGSHAVTVHLMSM